MVEKRIGRRKELLVKKWTNTVSSTLGLNWGTIRIAEESTLRNENSSGSDNNVLKMGAALDWYCGKSSGNIVAHICLHSFPLLIILRDSGELWKIMRSLPATHVRKNSVWNASASSRLISLSLKDVFSKVKFDDASKLLARVPIFLQNDTLSVFLQTKKSVFGVRQPTLTPVSTDDPCVPPRNFWRF